MAWAGCSAARSCARAIARVTILSATWGGGGGGCAGPGGTGGGTWERADGGGVVVGFHLHQDVLHGALFLIACSAYSDLAGG